MTIRLAAPTNPQTYAQGAWPFALMNTGLWEWQHTMGQASTVTRFDWCSCWCTDLSGGTTGGIFLTTSNTIEWYDTNDNLLAQSAVVAFTATSTPTIRTDRPGNLVTISGMTSGNGSTALAAGSIFRDTAMKAGGIPNQSGFAMIGTYGPVDDTLVGPTATASFLVPAPELVAAAAAPAAVAADMLVAAPELLATATATTTSTATADLLVPAPELAATAAAPAAIVGDLVVLAPILSADAAAPAAVAADMLVAAPELEATAVQGPPPLVVVAQLEVPAPELVAAAAAPAAIAADLVVLAPELVAAAAVAVVAAADLVVLAPELAAAAAAPAAAAADMLVVAPELLATATVASSVFGRGPASIKQKQWISGTPTGTLTTDAKTTPASGGILAWVHRGVYDGASPEAPFDGVNGFVAVAPRLDYVLWPGSAGRFWWDPSGVGGAGYQLSAAWGSSGYPSSPGDAGDEITIGYLVVANNGITDPVLVAYAEGEVAPGSATITSPSITIPNDEPTYLVAVANGTGFVDAAGHVFTPLDYGMTLNADATASTMFHGSGYIQQSTADGIVQGAGTYAPRWSAPNHAGSGYEGAVLRVFAFQARQPRNAIAQLVVPAPELSATALQIAAAQVVAQLEVPAPELAAAASVSVSVSASFLVPAPELVAAAAAPAAIAGDLVVLAPELEATANVVNPAQVVAQLEVPAPELAAAAAAPAAIAADLVVLAPELVAAAAAPAAIAGDLVVPAPTLSADAFVGSLAQVVAQLEVPAPELAATATVQPASQSGDDAMIGEPFRGTWRGSWIARWISRR